MGVTQTMTGGGEGTRRRRLLDSGAQLARKAASVPAKLPPGVRDQVRQSVKNLARVRSPKGARQALIAEAERLFVVATPLLAAAPLPLRGWRARMAAGTTGCAAAVVEQAEELAAVVSWGGALPATPVVVAAVMSGWLLELWISVSARVNQLKEAGRQVDPETLGRELAGAYLGDPDAVRRDGKSSVVRQIAVKAAQRWMIGLVPGAGIAYDTYASQRTVARILREPVTAHPLLYGQGGAAVRVTRSGRHHRTRPPRTLPLRMPEPPQ
jgi:hypothetical protein